MRKRTIARISVVTGAAALCMTVTTPAMACLAPDAMSHTGHTQAADPVAAAITKADHDIGSQLQQLDRWAAFVAADPNVSADQHAAFAAAITSAKAALQAEQTQVDAATSLDAVQAAQQSASVTAAEAVVGLGLAVVHANDTISAQASRLASLAAKVAAESDLNATQKADVAGAIAAAQTQLQNARLAANAATTNAAAQAAETSSAVSGALTTVDLRLAIDRADNQIDAVEAKLASWATQAAADPGLSGQQKSDIAAKIAAAQAGLAALRAQVDAATAPAQVGAALGAAHFASKPWMSDDPGRLPKSDPAQLAAIKRAGCDQSGRSGATTVTPNPVQSIVINKRTDPSPTTSRPNTSKPATSTPSTSTPVSKPALPVVASTPSNGGSRHDSGRDSNGHGSGRQHGHH